MKLLAYIRTSTDDKSAGQDAQLAAIKRYCELSGNELVEVLTDADVSGNLPLLEREAGYALHHLLEIEEAEAVIAHQIDRIFRNLGDGCQWLDVFEKNGWTLLTVEDRVNTSTPDGWAAAILKLYFADYECRKISFRSKNTAV